MPGTSRLYLLPLLRAIPTGCSGMTSSKLRESHRQYPESIPDAALGSLVTVDVIISKFTVLSKVTELFSDRKLG